MNLFAFRAWRESLNVCYAKKRFKIIDPKYKHFAEFIDGNKKTYVEFEYVNYGVDAKAFRWSGTHWVEFELYKDKDLLRGAKEKAEILYKHWSVRK